MAPKPIPKQRDRLEEVMNGKLAKIRLGDNCVGEASGPHIVVQPTESGQQGIATGWNFTVWLQHNKLIGQPPIGVTVPVADMMPADEFVVMVTERLLEEARKLRDKANNPPTTSSMDEMMAAYRAGAGNEANDNRAGG